MNEAGALGAPERAALEKAFAALAPMPPVSQKLEVRLGAPSSPALQASLFAGEKADRTERTRRLRGALESMEARFKGRALRGR